MNVLALIKKDYRMSLIEKKSGNPLIRKITVQTMRKEMKGYLKELGLVK